MWLISVFVITTVVSVLGQQNKRCLIPSMGSFGNCVPLRLCSELLVRNNIGQNGCSINEVCCPTAEHAGNMLSRSELKSQTLIEEFPHMVLIGYDTNFGRTWKCSGALIDEYTVLTAASCLSLPQLNGPTVIKTFNEEIPIIGGKPHPMYINMVRTYDIANLYLARPATFSSNVTKACISPSRRIPNQIIVSGWGTLSFDNMLHFTRNQNINFTHVDVQNDENDSFSIVQEGQSPCIADQGSLAHVYDETKLCSYLITGVLSNWKNCGEDRSSGLFSKITRADAWIRY